MNKLIDEAIDKSLKFEELMDKTDFDSWLESDKSGELPEWQDNEPFQEYKKNEKIISGVCCDMKKLGSEELPNNKDKSSLEKYLIFKLFDAKIKRVEARICSKKEDEQEKYKEALPYLLSALNEHDKFCLQMKQNGSNKSLNPE